MSKFDSKGTWSAGPRWPDIHAHGTLPNEQFKTCVVAVGDEKTAATKVLGA